MLMTVELGLYLPLKCSFLQTKIRYDTWLNNETRSRGPCLWIVLPYSSNTIVQSMMMGLPNAHADFVLFSLCLTTRRYSSMQRPVHLRPSIHGRHRKHSDLIRVDSELSLCLDCHVIGEQVSRGIIISYRKAPVKEKNPAPWTLPALAFASVWIQITPLSKGKLRFQKPGSVKIVKFIFDFRLSRAGIARLAVIYTDYS